MADMEESIQGKVILVTGALGGIGKALSQRIVKLGGKVVLTDLKLAEGIEYANELNQSIELNVTKDTHSIDSSTKVAVFQAADVTNYLQVKAVFQAGIDTFGRLDGVVNNAGISDVSNWYTDSDDNDTNDRYRTLHVNVVSVEIGTRLGLRYFTTQNREGVIVNSSSPAAFLPFPCSLYSVSKAAILASTRSNAMAHRVTKVRVNAVCPWWVRTGLLPTKVLDAISSQLIEMDEVIEAFIRALTDTSLNGDALMVRPDSTFVVTKNSDIAGPYGQFLVGENGMIEGRVTQIAEGMKDLKW